MTELYLGFEVFVNASGIWWNILCITSKDPQERHRQVWLETASETRCLDAPVMMNWLVESLNNLFLHYPGYCADRLLVCINLSGELTLPRPLQTIYTFLGNLTIKYFLKHPLRVISFDWKLETEPLYSVHRAITVKTQKWLVSNIPRCCNSIWFCPNWIRLGACPAFKKQGNRKVVQNTDVHDFSFCHSQSKIITAS